MFRAAVQAYFYSPHLTALPTFFSDHARRLHADLQKDRPARDTAHRIIFFVFFFRFDRHRLVPAYDPTQITRSISFNAFSIDFPKLRIPQSGIAFSISTERLFAKIADPVFQGRKR